MDVGIRRCSARLLSQTRYPITDADHGRYANAACEALSTASAGVPGLRVDVGLAGRFLTGDAARRRSP